MQFRERLANLILGERRNMAFSPSVLMSMQAARWLWAADDGITVDKAVKDGLKACGWVYRAVTIIARSAAKVPWAVQDIESGEWNDGHRLSKLLDNPCPDLSRLDLFILLHQWQQLTGLAYMYKVKAGNETRELWPISPEQIKPAGSKTRDKLLDGYFERTTGGYAKSLSAMFTRDLVVPFRFIDPSNPLEGISPLRAAARSVDTDVEQQTWNKSAMQNRGVVDTVISYKQEITQDQFDLVVAKLKERMSGSDNARMPFVTGNQADVKRLALSPVEMDFIASRKWNKEEIFTIFGVPMQLVGSEAASTYDNFNTARRVLWELTIIPILDDHADTLNRAFQDELSAGERIWYDTSGITALQDDQERQAKVARQYWDMGVPMDVINERLSLGLDEFPGSGLPWGGRRSVQATGDESRRLFYLRETRDVEAEQNRRDEWAEGDVQSTLFAMLSEQEEGVYVRLDEGQSAADIEEFILRGDGWDANLRNIVEEVATDFAHRITVTRSGADPFAEHRDEFADAFNRELSKYLEKENWLLTEKSNIVQTTATAVLDQIKDGFENGKTVQEIKDAIQDVGAFGPERALRLARTLAGTGASIGQLSAAKVSGATRKTWVTSGFEVRELHQQRGGDTVNIEDPFPNLGYGAPQYPLDAVLSPADRVNCRCSMTFT